MGVFTRGVRHVARGSAVSAANTSRPSRDLEQRTNKLYEMLAAIVSRSALVADKQPVESTVRDGTAVYWAADTQAYEPALAEVEIDEDVGSYVPAPSADCVGVAVNRAGELTADIVFVGLIELTPTQLTNLIVDEEPQPGRYYLSSTHPGKLTRQRPSASVAVGILFGPLDDCETSQKFLVFPQQRNFIEDHVHYQVELVAEPAGTHVPPEEGGRHEITDPDTSLPGWLPADHAVFSSHAPTGARFGYNIAAHTALSRIWPPLPIEAAILECYHNTDAPEVFPLAGRVLPEFVVIDAYGIWWMSDCYDQVPWPTLLDTTIDTTDSTSSTSSESLGVQCPTTSSLRLILSFLKQTFLANRTSVSSLRTVAGQPIRITNLDGGAATTGDLLVRLLLDDLVTATDATGGLVLKEVEDGTLRFQKGYVIEGVIADSDEIEITSTVQRPLDPEDEESATVHQGIVRIAVNTEPGAKELSPQLIKLGDAIERELDGVLYIGFDAGRNSTIKVPFFVPTSNVPASPTLQIKAQLFSPSAGPWCEMTLTVMRLAAPVDDTPTPIPGDTVDVAFDVVTPSEELDESSMITVRSDTFDVAAGDTVIVNLSRAVDAEPDFAGEIGLIRLVAVLAAGG